ncbi:MULTISPECIES: FKBP-type peptidyl-prolyl cis-trans isomerase [Pseudidiomarina]|uniref:Peptidyl-prolyl cis-trans isomerase n=3 Tax=Pseudidiomarina TaxID=2800384 RepID=A0A368V3S7_9GAMM|nr:MULTISPECIES: FKBP-type peptidyl-prolyl cis-trans isomerase [Pseudidiomarina]PWW14083.1 FKBP-type peptidyl-prolyl cis-trans isomerase FkpA [Pseudidiomarina maritima]RBP91897.1 FKBP-type peptidyl-prolyl cis-trans isomerase FkpA [Pseudidiomarina tainanensis]RCW33661.1 FKBP-type peptidyl-prolyl cis-trans isomerase FkpA [Pseudidiomarina tainanensis]
MKQFKKPLALALVALAVSGCMQQQEEAKPTGPVSYQVSETAPVDEREKMAYALGSSVGTFVGKTLDRQEEADFLLDRDLVITGFVDAVKAEAKLSQAEAEELLMTMQEVVTEQRQQVLGGKAQAEGEAYLAENAQREGVTVTESGLQYEVISEGAEGGAQPTETDIVEVHYEGTLINGEVFDSSVERGEPAVFPLNRVIAGWTEGVQLMSVGDKFRFVIPAALAYGEREVGNGLIPANSTLIFEVELLDVKQAQTAEDNAVDAG